jgi:hypothetical protein
MQGMRPCYAVDAHAYVMGPSSRRCCLDRAGTPRGALVRGKYAGRLLAADDNSSIRGVRTSRDTRSDQSACQIRGPREA